ncbi:MAG: cobalt ECF transporter T component CbiQ, partial [Spirochaetota bacterium]
MRFAFLHKYTNNKSIIHNLDARCKIILCIGCVIISTTTPSHGYGAFLGYFVIILLAIVLSRIPLTFYLNRSLVIIPFVIMVAVFIPFMKHADVPDNIFAVIGPLEISRTGLRQFGIIGIKAYLSVLSIIILSSTTSFPTLLDGFERLKFPGLIIMLIGLTYRYIFILFEELLTMKRARDSRGYDGKW